jgi:hypothetical protein
LWFEALESRQLLSSVALTTASPRVHRHHPPAHHHRTGTGGTASPAAAASAVLDTSRLIFSDAQTAGGSAPRSVTLMNVGSVPITLTGRAFSGPNAAEFSFVNAPAVGTVIPAGGSVQIPVSYTAAATSAAVIRTATLTITTSDTAAPSLPVALRAVAMTGYQGGPEPSLSMLMTLYQIPVNIGSTALNIPYNLNGTTTVLDGEEVLAQRFQKAGAGPVTIEPIATFGPAATPDYTFGYYYPTHANSTVPIFTAETPAGSPAGGDAQTVNPIPTAVGAATLANADTVSFDPGAGPFGLDAAFTGTTPQLTAYSEDALNTIVVGGANKNRRIRFWPLKNTDGSLVANAYVAGIEEATNNDLQDVVFILRNVSIAPANVDIVGPTVTGVAVGGSTWAVPAYNMPTGAGQLAALPWTNLNQVQIKFSEDVNITSGALSLTGAKTIYTPSAFAYDAGTFTAKWTLPAGLTNDRLHLTLTGVTDKTGNPLDGEWTDGSSVFPSGDGTPGGNFAYAINVLPGDVNGDGFVLGDDGSAVRNLLGVDSTLPNYNQRADLNGDGLILGDDGSAVRNHLGNILQ